MGLRDKMAAALAGGLGGLAGGAGVSSGLGKGLGGLAQGLGANDASGLSRLWHRPKAMEMAPKAKMGGMPMTPPPMMPGQAPIKQIPLAPPPPMTSPRLRPRMDPMRYRM